MAIRHIVTIQAAAGRSRDFNRAFEDLRAVALSEAGCEQYELFQSVGAPNKMVILERWGSLELLAAHMLADRTANMVLVNAIIALWEPGSTPTVERFETTP
jgi:quinol monooxygenase YgiN